MIWEPLSEAVCKISKFFALENRIFTLAIDDPHLKTITHLSTFRVSKDLLSLLSVRHFDPEGLLQ